MPAPEALRDKPASEEGAAVPASIYDTSAFGEPNLDSYQIVRDAIEQLDYGSWSQPSGPAGPSRTRRPLMST